MPQAEIHSLVTDQNDLSSKTVRPGLGLFLSCRPTFSPSLWSTPQMQPQSSRIKHGPPGTPVSLLPSLEVQAQRPCFQEASYAPSKSSCSCFLPPTLLHPPLAHHTLDPRHTNANTHCAHRRAVGWVFACSRKCGTETAGNNVCWMSALRAVAAGSLLFMLPSPPGPAGGVWTSVHAHLLAGGGAPEVPGLHGPHICLVLFTWDYLLLVRVPTSRHDSRPRQPLYIWQETGG